MKRCLPSENPKIHRGFWHLFKANLILLTDTPTLTFHSTTQSKPSCASCISSWLAGLTLGIYTCSNVKLWRCKLTNILTVTSANNFFLHKEQLFSTRQQFIRKNVKIISMEKCRFQFLTCKVLIHNDVFHNKRLLSTCAFLLYSCFLDQNSYFIAYTLYLS